jgi:thiosulfate reductase/polysulfide reductase chain A
VNTRLQSIGYTVEKLRGENGIIVQKGKPYLADFKNASPFLTQSGKIEFYSDELALGGQDPIPTYTPTEEPPAGLLPPALWPPPGAHLCQDAEHAGAHQLNAENDLWLNADVAAAQGIQEGDRVWLENQDGARTGPIRVKATQRIRPDAVFMSHGFGRNAPAADARQRPRRQRRHADHPLRARSHQRRGRDARQLRPPCEGGVTWQPMPFCSTFPAASAARRAPPPA